LAKGILKDTTDIGELNTLNVPLSIEKARSITPRITFNLIYFKGMNKNQLKTKEKYSFIKP
jgi:hypothetical protein